MSPVKTTIPGDDLDGLRLLALSRIPRCGTCPRFHALVEAHDRGLRVGGRLPGAPAYCSHEVCAPLVARWSCSGPSRSEVAPSATVRLQAS